MGGPKNSSDLTDINNLFRPMNEYVAMLGDIILLLHKRNFQAHDIQTIAGGLGFVGNQAIRRHFTIPEYADQVVRIAVQQGINAMRITERLVQEGKETK